jgi:hypothetical protein
MAYYHKNYGVLGVTIGLVLVHCELKLMNTNVHNEHVLNVLPPQLKLGYLVCSDPELIPKPRFIWAYCRRLYVRNWQRSEALLTKCSC